MNQFLRVLLKAVSLLVRSLMITELVPAVPGVMKNRPGWYSGSGDQNGINTKNPNKAFNPAWCRRNLRAVNNRDKVFWEQRRKKNTFRGIFLLFQSKIVVQKSSWWQSKVQNSKLPRQFIQNIYRNKTICSIRNHYDYDNTTVSSLMYNQHLHNQHLFRIQHLDPPILNSTNQNRAHMVVLKVRYQN